MAKTSFFENQNSNAINPQDFNALVATLESRNNTALANLSTSQTQLDTANTLLAQTTQTVNTQTATSVQAASNSSTSATNSATSAAAALVSQNAANASKLAAATSETNAAGSASTASTQATNAAASATAANTSKVNAGTSETNALASKNAAGTSETNAATSAAQALASKNAAGTSETNAATSAAQALASKNAAATSETNALASKNAAATSATNAGTSETNALASKNAAATSATNAASSLTSFQNQYQGAKAVAPTLRNDATALQAGDLYFDTTLSPQASMKVYNGSAWINAGSTVNGTSKRQAWVATVAQTTFAVSGGYDSSFIDVYLNGVRQKNGVDVVVTSGTNIVFAQGLMVGDEVEAIAFGAFSVANTYDQPTIDAKANQLQFRNKLLNGSMDIWQRGVSFTGVYTNQNNSYYGADRWQMFRAAGSAGATFSRIAWQINDFTYAARLQRNQGDTSTNNLNLAQSLETGDIYALRGKVVTLSFRYYLAANFSGGALYASATWGTGVDGNLASGFTNAASVPGSSITPGGSLGVLQSVSVTFTVPASATQFGINIGFNPTGTAGVNDYVEISNVQLELGSVATAFERRPLTLELMLCQRYYEEQAYVWNTSVAQYITGSFKVSKRVPPTLVSAPDAGTGGNIIVTGTNSYFQQTAHTQISGGVVKGNAEI